MFAQWDVTITMCSGVSINNKFIRFNGVCDGYPSVLEHVQPVGCGSNMASWKIALKLRFNGLIEIRYHLYNPKQYNVVAQVVRYVGLWLAQLLSVADSGT